VKIRFKRVHPDALPKRPRAGDAGFDLKAMIMSKDNEYYVEYDTGIAVEIPEGFVGLLFPRSSISKYNHDMANSVGVIDAGYRGTIKIRFRKLDITEHDRFYKIGDKIAQLVIVPLPHVEFEEAKDLSHTDRDGAGFGSTGD